MGLPQEEYRAGCTDKSSEASRPCQEPHSFAFGQLRKGRQARTLLVSCLIRWVITLVFCACIYIVLWQYSSKETMVSSKREGFNVLIIFLSIALGLNLASSLKHMVAFLRWWVLSWREWKPREADLILQSENITRMLRLMCLSRCHTIQLYIVVCILLNVAAQIGVATLGLVYTMNGADKIVPTKPGIVSVPDLSTLQTVKLSSPSEATGNQSQNSLRYVANSYGLFGQAAGVQVVSHVEPPQPGLLYNIDANPISCVNTTCYSWFYEATLANSSYYLIAASNRSVATTSSCQHWKVTQGGAGDSNNITVADGKNTTYQIPTMNGPSQTTFFVDPGNDQHVGWSEISVFEASAKDPWFFKCNVSVGPVENAVIPEHQLGDTIRLMAPAAIALQGYGSSPLGTNETDRIQFQSYPAETIVGSACGGDDRCMGLTTSSFAAGVILVAAQSNSNLNVTGQVPLKGIKLDIESWTDVHIILGLIMGLHLLLLVISILLVSRVMVRDRSHFGEATLLRSAMHDLSYDAAMCNEREIASLFPARTTMKYVPGTNGAFYFRVTS